MTVSLFFWRRTAQQELPHRDGWVRSTSPLLRVHLPTMLPRSSSTEFPSGPERLPCCCSLFGCGVSETLGGNTGRGDRTPANARNTSTRGCGLLTGKTGAKPITEVMIFHLHNWQLPLHVYVCTCDCVIMSCYQSDFEKCGFLHHDVVDIYV